MGRGEHNPSRKVVEDRFDRAELGQEASFSEDSDATPSTGSFAPEPVEYRTRGSVRPGARRQRVIADVVKGPSYRSSRGEGSYQGHQQWDGERIRRWLAIIAALMVIALALVLSEQYATLSVKLRVLQTKKIAMENQLESSKQATAQLNARITKLKSTITQVQDKFSAELKKASKAVVAEYDQTVDALRMQVGLSMQYLEKNKMYAQKLELAKKQIQKMELISRDGSVA